MRVSGRQPLLQPTGYTPLCLTDATPSITFGEFGIHGPSMKWGSERRRLCTAFYRHGEPAELETSSTPPPVGFRSVGCTEPSLPSIQGQDI